MVHINTLCGQNAEYFNIKAGGAYTVCPESLYGVLKNCDAQTN
jgi:hypothetical protein